MHKKAHIKNDKFHATRINEQLLGSSKIRIVSDEGAEIIPTDVALKKAKDEGLDLVEVSSGQEIPVCKIIDYGKFRFEQLKKTKEAKKKQHIITIKEIKLRPRIDIHDYEIKKRQTIEFLSKGDKVKVSLRFKGRELAHTDIGMNIVVKLVEELQEHGTPEKAPIQDGRQIIVIINPK